MSMKTFLSVITSVEKCRRHWTLIKLSRAQVLSVCVLTCYQKVGSAVRIRKVFTLKLKYTLGLRPLNRSELSQSTSNLTKHGSKRGKGMDSTPGQSGHTSTCEKLAWVLHMGPLVRYTGLTMSIPRFTAHSISKSSSFQENIDITWGITVLTTVHFSKQSLQDF